MYWKIYQSGPTWTWDDIVAYVFSIRREPMIETRGQNDKIIFFNPDSNPAVCAVSYVEETPAIEYVTDFLVFMQMLYEKHLDLLLVNWAHALGRNDDLVPVFVTTLWCDSIDWREWRTMFVKNAELRKHIDTDGTSGIMFLALVTLPKCQDLLADLEHPYWLEARRTDMLSFLTGLNLSSSKMPWMRLWNRIRKTKKITFRFYVRLKKWLIFVRHKIRRFLIALNEVRKKSGKFPEILPKYHDFSKSLLLYHDFTNIPRLY